MKEKLLLVDGNSVLFRGFYATYYSGRIMQTSNGTYTNGVYAFAIMLNDAIRKIKPDYLVVAFDKGKHNFRHELSQDYKAGRKQTPVELVEQFKITRELVSSYGLKYLEMDNIEADDIIGVLSKKFNLKTYIFSSDRDLLQLIDENVNVCLMKKGTSDLDVVDEKRLQELMNLTPSQIIDYKALAGDKSDNIKGVEGIGEKTATNLLNLYQNIEGIYQNIDSIKGKTKDKLLNGKESCFLSKKLATIITEYDIELNLADIKCRVNVDTKNAFFEKYEMLSLIENIKEETTNVNIVSKISPASLNDAFIFLDKKYSSYKNTNVFGINFINKDSQEYIKFEDFLKDEQAIKYLESNKHKVVYDLKDFRYILDEFNIKIDFDNSDDLMIMSFLLNNNYDSFVSLLHGLRIATIQDENEVYGSEKRPILDDRHIEYSYKLASYLYKAYKLVKKDLEKENIDNLYQNIEKPLIKILYEMEKHGIYVNGNTLDEIALENSEKLNALTKEIHEIAGEEFNITSVKQLSYILYDKLKLPNLSKGSTDQESLFKIVGYSKIVPLILSYRKYSKINSTYAIGLKKNIEKDHKIHTYYLQAKTNTGRLSSIEPNLQNISIKDDEAKLIRKAFVASEDSYLVSFDYSQNELRMLASFANEEKMIEAFNNDIDIHTLTAMNMFNLKKEEVSDYYRRQAKAINFGIVYGISNFGLANQVGIDFKKAQDYINQYFITYPRIKEYLDKQVELCQKQGYVSTILNRRRYIDDIYSKNYGKVEFAKRAAKNATIQGSAADLIKKAMIDVYNELNKRNLKSKLILQVHDELILDVLKEEIEIIKEIIPNIMSNALAIKCDLKCSFSYGNNWYEAK